MLSKELRKRGIFISSSGVRSVLLRNNLENVKKRLKALEKKVAQEGTLLSESQIAFAKLYTTKTPITAADLFNLDFITLSAH